MNDGKNVISKNVVFDAINAKNNLEERLKDVLEGLLRLEYTDACDNKMLFNYNTSFIIKKPVSFIYIPDIKNKKLGLKMEKCF